MNKYPYTNYQDLNLDWVIKVVTDIDGAGAKAAKAATDAATAADASATDASNSSAAAAASSDNAQAAATAATNNAANAQAAATAATNNAANASVSAATARTQASAAEAAATRAEAAAKSTIGFVWEGAWDSKTTYNKNNLVFYRPSAYICKFDNTYGEPPDLDPENWDIFCEGTM